MSYTTDLHDDDVFTILRAFILDVLGASVSEVVRVPNNSVPTPRIFPYITLSERMRSIVHWPIPSVSDPVVQPQQVTLLSGVDYDIQVDAYGPTSGDLIQMLYALFCAGDAFDFFNAQATSGILPLYAEAPHQSAIVDGEAEYEKRWIMPVHLQYNPTISTTIETASTVVVNDIINVEASYH